MKLFSSIFMAFLLMGLVSSCKKDTAEKATVGAAKEVAKAVGKSYTVDSANSKINWTGSKPTGEHTGTINISSGKVTVSDGKVTAGSFVMDMNTIKCTDLSGDQALSLEAHLKGTRSPEEVDDFFNVAKFPTAKFDLTKTTNLANDPAASHLVYGNLTMKGVTKEIGFKANINVSDNGVTVQAPDFGINRTDWGIKFMSKNFVDGLKEKFIDDEIQVGINLKAM